MFVITRVKISCVQTVLVEGQNIDGEDQEDNETVWPQDTNKSE